MSKKVKKHIFEVLELSLADNKVDKFVDGFIISLILLNILAVIMQTVEGLAEYAQVFRYFEIFSIVLFTIEYLLRLWSSTAEEKFKGLIKGRIRFATTPLAIIDLLAVLPFYLPFLFGFDLRIIRVLRLFRVFSLLKLTRYSSSLKTLSNVFRARREELTIVLTAVAILLVFSSSLVYFVENEVQPQAFSDIPQAMWWGIVTLTTVGYGDVAPITAAGKILAGVISLLGVGLFVLPAGILASGFAEEIQKNKIEIVCPHCGKEHTPSNKHLSKHHSGN